MSILFTKRPFHRNEVCMNFIPIPGYILMRISLLRKGVTFKSIRVSAGEVYKKELSRFIKTHYKIGDTFVVHTHESFINAVGLRNYCKVEQDRTAKVKHSKLRVENFITYGLGVRLRLLGIPYKTIKGYKGREHTMLKFKVTINNLPK